jgi:hypothetical protein
VEDRPAFLSFVGFYFSISYAQAVVDSMCINQRLQNLFRVFRRAIQARLKPRVPRYWLKSTSTGAVWAIIIGDAANVFNRLRRRNFGLTVAIWKQSMGQEPNMKPLAHDTSRSSMTQSAVCRFSISLLAVAGLAAAQDQTPHAWRSVNDPLPATLDQAPGDQPGQPPSVNAQPDSAQGGGSLQNNTPSDAQSNQAPPTGQYNAPPPPPYNAPPPPDNYGVPPHLMLKAGTYVTVRMNQWLSSDRNKQGDTFAASLQQPIVVDGFVVAQRGQTVYGRVSEAQKAGRVEGTSRLGLQLTQLSLVDGNQAPVQSQMVTRNGPTSVGRDAAAIGGTTALGAAIGAGVNGGVGAGVGAGAGAVVGIIGVLLTRGQPTVIYPESVVTFQIQAPVDIATDKAPQAFRYVNSQPNPQYRQGPATGYRGPGGYPAPPAPGYGYGPAPAPVYVPAYPGYAYGYPYPYYGGFGVYVGPGWGYYGRGYYGWRR